MKTGYKVCDAMTRAPIVINDEDDLRKCAEQMEEHHIGAVLVKSAKRLVGVVTEQDIVRKVVAKGKNPNNIKAKDIMETNIVRIAPEQDIFDALIKMRDLNIRHLPVMVGDEMIGLLTLKDILKIQPQLFELLVEKFELREEERKPINNPRPSEGICHSCGEYTGELSPVDGTLRCPDCREL